MTRLNFDFCWIPEGSADRFTQMASLGESLGYRTMWIPDQDFGHDPFILAAAVAGATARIGIGIGITSPLVRHPVHIARAAASLNDLSHGRLRLGLGSGNIANVVRPMGVSGAHTSRRLEAGARAVVSLLAGEAVTFADDERPVHIDVDWSRRIPLYIGARGPRTIQLAGKVADGVLAESLFSGGGMSYVAENLQRGADSVRGDRQPSGFDLVAWQTVVVSDDVTADLDRFRPWVARMMQAGPPVALSRIGIDPENTERVLQMCADGREADAVSSVTNASARRIVMIGSPTDVVCQIERLRDHGATSLSVVSSAGYDETASNISKIAEEVMPAFQ